GREDDRPAVGADARGVALTNGRGVRSANHVDRLPPSVAKTDDGARKGVRAEERRCLVHQEPAVAADGRRRGAAEGDAPARGLCLERDAAIVKVDDVEIGAIVDVSGSEARVGYERDVPPVGAYGGRWPLGESSHIGLPDREEPGGRFVDGRSVRERETS